MNLYKIANIVAGIGKSVSLLGITLAAAAAISMVVIDPSQPATLCLRIGGGMAISGAVVILWSVALAEIAARL